ncbi:MAG TPA: dihydrodipicolinate synthase family protein [Candidatus Dormibacteraeota bacterium]|nr:dihydrodipicolinate synthase family protein [Candidatus Dormibacteraeota bacterium]
MTPFHGIFCPMLTPLNHDETIDQASMRRLIDFLIDGGVHGIWVMGTTGEFAVLPETERARAVALTVEHVAGRVPVIANVGDSSTGLALRHARHAVQAGADALACTPPHYYLHSMDEVITHYRALKVAFPDTPLFIYNIPQTVKVKMTLAATLQLAREGTASGIKDSQNDLQWFRALATAICEERRESDFRLFLGTRTLIDVGVVAGAHGAIPANSNVVPRACVMAYESAVAGDWAGARAAQALATRYDDLAEVARGGSANAATLSSLKHVLRSWGIVDDPTVARPSRSLTPDEVAELNRRLQSLPRTPPGD